MALAAPLPGAAAFGFRIFAAVQRARGSGLGLAGAVGGAVLVGASGAQAAGRRRGLLAALRAEPRTIRSATRAHFSSISSEAVSTTTAMSWKSFTRSRTATLSPSTPKGRSPRPTQGSGHDPAAESGREDAPVAGRDHHCDGGQASRLRRAAVGLEKPGDFRRSSPEGLIGARPWTSRRPAAGRASAVRFPTPTWSRGWPTATQSKAVCATASGSGSAPPNAGRKDCAPDVEIGNPRPGSTCAIRAPRSGGFRNAPCSFER